MTSTWMHWWAVWCHCSPPSQAKRLASKWMEAATLRTWHCRTSRSASAAWPSMRVMSFGRYQVFPLTLAGSCSTNIVELCAQVKRALLWQLSCSGASVAQGTQARFAKVPVGWVCLGVCCTQLLPAHLRHTTVMLASCADSIPCCCVLLLCIRLACAW